jgi:twitching motility protein PilT
MLSTSLRGVISQQLLQKADGEGRVAAMEILINTSAAANLIRQGKLDQLETVMQSGGRWACARWIQRHPARCSTAADQRPRGVRQGINKAKFEPSRSDLSGARALPSRGASRRRVIMRF